MFCIVDMILDIDEVTLIFIRSKIGMIHRVTTHVPELLHRNTPYPNNCLMKINFLDIRFA